MGCSLETFLLYSHKTLHVIIIIIIIILLIILLLIIILIIIKTVVRLAENSLGSIYRHCHFVCTVTCVDLCTSGTSHQINNAAF